MSEKRIARVKYAMIDFLSRIGTEVSVPKGYVIYEYGDTYIPDVHVIVEGAVKAFEYTAAGNEYIFNKLESSDIILFQSAIRNELPHLSFATMEPSILIKAPADKVRQALIDNHEFALYTIQYLSDELVVARRNLRHTEELSIDWRVCNILLEMANKFGEPYDNKLLITQKLSQQVMANMLRVSRITVARAVKDLKDSGIIEIVNGHYCIRDMTGLLNRLEELDSREV